MSRARSKTADPSEVRKKNALPRRLNEKIALMKKKERVESQAFEQAMQSIFEMQQAQLHGGGGSMPSLQNIDSAPPNPFNQLSSPPVLSQMNSLDKPSRLTTPPTIRERPLSGGTTGRNLPVERTLSCDVDSHVRLPPYHPSDSNWGNMHKSESDLQQSLVDRMILQTPPFVQPQAPPTIITSTSPGLNGDRVYLAQNEQQELWRNQQFSTGYRSRPMDMPCIHGNNNSSSVSAVLLSPDHSGGGMTSNIDPAHIGSASSLPDLTNIEFSSGLDVPLERDDDSPTYNKPNIFHFPSPGPSKLTFSSMAPPSPSHFEKMAAVSEVRSHPYFQPHVSSAGRIPRSPTMPEFRVHSSQLSAPTTRKFQPVATTNSYHHGYQTPPNCSESYMSMLSTNPPLSHSSLSPSFNGGTYNSSPFVQNSNELNSYSSEGIQSYQNGSSQSTNFHHDPLLPSLLLGMDQQTGQLPGSPAKPPSLASTASSGYVSLPPYIDTSLLMTQQRALQQKLAGISVFKDNPPLRSHSEENLMKMPKDGSKGDSIMQQNPFMGNMSNANSVPCVYVDPSGVEPCIDEFDSYTNGTGSPSTSASHASSPPSHRPEWIEHPHAMNDFVFQDWALESTGNPSLSDKLKFGSPLAHHKSLTELNKTADYINMDLSPNAFARAHQLSLPSIVMGDLIAMEEQGLEKQGSGPFLPTDFDMEEEVMETLLRNEDFSSFSGNPVDGDSILLNSLDLYQYSNDSLKY